MKIAVCDDDKMEREQILSLLDTYEKKRNIKVICKSFESSIELASTAVREHYDLYLLDVIMPVLNGIDTAKEIREFDKAADVIFLTSSPEFAVESYTVKAANYLLKPLCEKKFFDALDDILEKRRTEEENYIILKSNLSVHKIFLSDLVYVEAFNRKSIYYLKNGEQIECVERFSSTCENLLKNPAFLLVHRSFVVNLNYICTIGTVSLELSNGKIIPLAQRRAADIKKQYLAFQMEQLR